MAAVLKKKNNDKTNKNKTPRVFTIFLEFFTSGKLCFFKEFKSGGTPHMKGVGMFVGNFELNP